MINFRFHLVSLIAVFLALAVGVVVGSTVVDRAIVDGLENQIDRVERNADRERQENAELRSQLSRQSVYSEELGAFAVQRRLAGVPVAVVAVRGVDSDDVRRSADLVREAGGDAPAVVWLEPKWELDDDDDVADLAQALGLAVPSLPEDAEGEPREAVLGPLRERALSVLAVRLAAGGSLRPAAALRRLGRQPDARPRGDLLVLLEDAGFVSLDRADDDLDVSAYPPAGTRVVLVDGPGGRVDAARLAVPLTRALVERSLLTLVAEAGVDTPEEGEEPEVGGAIALRRDDDLAGRLSTVDGVDTLPGRVGLVLALDELGRGARGHYGIGPRASGLLPEAARG